MTLILTYIYIYLYIHNSMKTKERKPMVFDRKIQRKIFDQCRLMRRRARKNSKLERLLQKKKHIGHN